jgi:hypothetical protein
MMKEEGIHENKRMKEAYKSTTPWGWQPEFKTLLLLLLLQLQLLLLLPPLQLLLCTIISTAIIIIIIIAMTRGSSVGIATA